MGDDKARARHAAREPIPDRMQRVLMSADWDAGSPTSFARSLKLITSVAPVTRRRRSGDRLVTRRRPGSAAQPSLRGLSVGADGASPPLVRRGSGATSSVCSPS